MRSQMDQWMEFIPAPRHIYPTLLHGIIPKPVVGVVSPKDRPADRPKGRPPKPSSNRSGRGTPGSGIPKSSMKVAVSSPADPSRQPADKDDVASKVFDLDYSLDEIVERLGLSTKWSRLTMDRCLINKIKLGCSYAPETEEVLRVLTDLLDGSTKM